MIFEGNGTLLQYSCLENPMDGGAWWAAVHGVAEGRTRLSDFTLTSHFHALEKEMATHSSVLAWRVPGTGEPGGLPSMGSHRVGHDWSDLATYIYIFCCHVKNLVKSNVYQFYWPFLRLQLGPELVYVFNRRSLMKLSSSPASHWCSYRIRVTSKCFEGK